MAQLESIERPNSEIQRRKRVQQVQCRDRWTGCCLNKDCWAFQNIDGKYYCVKDGLPANPIRYEYGVSKKGKWR